MFIIKPKSPEGNMGQLFNSYDVIRAVKASQVRRNEAARAQRKREQARELFVRYFSKISSKSN